MRLPEISFLPGTYALNAGPNFNFRLNRAIQWNDGRLGDIGPVSGGSEPRRIGSGR